MRIFAFRRRLLLAAMFSIAVVVLNLLTIRYLVAEDWEKVNLGALAGHKIAVDPGHGGIDDGASGNGVVEKEVTLAISLKLADILRRHGAEVVLTRDSDTDYYTRGKGGKRNDLLTRVEMINSSGAEVFISIHVNSIRGSAAWAGAQVFYSPNLEANKPLAELVQRALKNFPPGNKRQAKQDKEILILNQTNIPGVLVETGFLSNPGEAARLVDAAYQQKLAEYIAKALAHHFSQNVGR
ncbi:N-acetylmuramoyl-L-alanine amidase [Sporolituus thermophilus]|uniref:N-acetylmuramoyl-L-alanine amidase n=1 Tax=Sporolituus thermophilus DSM 23256 TaxID=1123285 RepID=A0A1G7LP45_9FIRM|nr:N-acetylmuramoyl-L-alanine amidase [Sporolituus thermophilus]SDF51302.1 N-acetylmuramoyl-L-alanine amidase [Sporolituus thermophilus DSM 23256]